MQKTFVAILLNIVLVLVSFGQLTRISWPGQPVFFYAFEPIVLVATLLMLYRCRHELFQNSVFKITAAFLGFMYFSLLISLFWYSFEENFVAVLYLLRMSTYFLFVPVSLIYFKENSIGSISKIMLYLVSLWVIVSSLIQYFLYQNLGNLAYLGWDPHLYRLVGLFFDPPMTIAVFVLIGLYYFTLLKKTKREVVTHWILILALLALSFLTYSRGGYLGIIAVVIAVLIQSKNLKLIVLSCVVVLTGLLFIPKGESEGINLLRTTSIGARVADYQKAIVIWQKSPITGIGYNHIRPEKDIYETQKYYGPYNPSHGSSGFHSSFLVILVTGGVIGVVLLGAVLVSIAKLSALYLYSVIFLSVLSLFDNVLLHPFILFLWGYLGSIQTIQSSRS